VILLDTSVWADHFRGAVSHVVELIESGQVIQHSFVTGELALGNPPERETMVSVLDAFPQAPIVPHSDLMAFVQRHELGGSGIGFVDANLLVSVAVADSAELWTRDKRLLAQAERLGLAYAA